MGKRDYHAQKKAVVETQDDIVGELIRFWREVMKGSMVNQLDNGQLTEGIIPIECRLKASELLAKYVTPPPKKSQSKAPINVTTTTSASPSVLDAAYKLEQLSGSDIDALLDQMFAGEPK